MILKALLPNLRKGSGKLVLNISSQLGSLEDVLPGLSYAYCMSKSAMNMFTRKAHQDLSGEGFIVVSYCPGWNKTDMGGPDAPLESQDSIRQLLAAAARLGKADSGRFFNYDGSPRAW